MDTSQSLVVFGGCLFVLLAKLVSCGLQGVTGFLVHVEVDLAPGLPSLEVVGLPDTALRESKHRVRAAIRNFLGEFPLGRITINLGPANIPKAGPAYDLSLAIGILMAAGKFSPSLDVSRIAVLGELALDGSIKPISGLLARLISLREEGLTGCIIPARNTPEANYIRDIAVWPVENLRDAVNTLKKGNAPLITGTSLELCKKPAITGSAGVDYSDIRGQELAKRAMQVAAAGQHNVLLVGPPGTGKTMLARRLLTIMPPASEAEWLDILRIHTCMGEYGLAKEMGAVPGVVDRPFRSPHHTTTVTGIMGGGLYPVPGEVTLSHRGVLLLDEVAEFRREVLESLRQPLEDREVSLSRHRYHVTFPADFLLVCTMNPCPCGYAGSGYRDCTCSDGEIFRYRQRLSGPFLDRIDLQVRVEEVDEGVQDTIGTSSKDLEAGVMGAWLRQQARYHDKEFQFNGRLPPALIDKFCRFEPRAKSFLRTAARRLKLSMRGQARVSKVALTIADLDGSDVIEQRHVAEAISLRVAAQV